MSRGWDNWASHAPEPHVLMFRRTIEMSKQIRAEDRARAAKEKEEFEAAEKAKAASRGVRVKKEEEEDDSNKLLTVSRSLVEVKKEEDTEAPALQLQSQPSHL